MSPQTSPTAAANAVTILVNDQARSFAPGVTLAEVVASLGWADRKGIAAAVNATVVPRREWSARALLTGDRVLVIQATQGG